tara:strand:+ start:31537 stop:32028 length:492 start_codon:yes stop_codon:yes gene_type:complete
MFDGSTLFLDRDGVINKKLEGRYVRFFEEFSFMPGAITAISKLSQVFQYIIIITNQQGIGKGLMTEIELDLLHKQMIHELKKKGGKIDAIYYCTDLASKKCNCRKPGTKMFENAIKDFPKIDIIKSYMIGDSDSDIQAGNAMQLNTVKVNNIYTLAKWADEFL